MSDQQIGEYLLLAESVLIVGGIVGLFLYCLIKLTFNSKN